MENGLLSTNRWNRDRKQRESPRSNDWNRDLTQRENPRSNDWNRDRKQRENPRSNDWNRDLTQRENPRSNDWNRDLTQRESPRSNDWNRDRKQRESPRSLVPPRLAARFAPVGRCSACVVGAATSDRPLSFPPAQTVEPADAGGNERGDAFDRPGLAALLAAPFVRFAHWGSVCGAYVVRDGSNASGLSGCLRSRS